mmetsp:Transcript_11055/g.22898  ORF Transcript_11055/g.22898 Transcript_11055/m.22898 type:complete len:158 (+) Transcript_11055:110-583(+)
MSTISSRCRVLLTKRTRNRTTTRISMTIRSLTQTAMDWKRPMPYFTTTTANRTFNSTVATNDNKIYLHVGPSGDSWIGDAIFAAKHNQPGYVKSIALFDDSNVGCKDTTIGIHEDEGSLLIEALEEHPEWAQEIYDTEVFPQSLQQHLKSLYEEDTK